MSQAWLLELGAGYRAAAGERELVHLLYAPASYPVPRTPAYARRVLHWQERLLPVLDLATRLGGETCVSDHLIAGVFAYQDKRGAPPQYGALWLAAPPKRVDVEDPQACELAEPVTVWQSLAISCFAYEAKPVPILDLRRLFGEMPHEVPVGGDASMPSTVVTG
jgi:hypothetical protein